MKPNCRKTALRRARSASFDCRAGILTLAIATLIAPVTGSIAQEDEPDPFFPESKSSEVHQAQTAEVVWRSGSSIRFDSAAIRIRAAADLFVCLRPPDLPRAQPEVLRFDGKEHLVKLLVEDREIGLCLLGRTDQKGNAKDGIELDRATTWPMPGTRVRALDPDHPGKKGVPGRIAGRDLIYQGEELPGTRLRVFLNPEVILERALPLTDDRQSRLLGFVLPPSLGEPGEFHAVPAAFIAKLLRDYETSEAATKSKKLGARFDVGSTTPQVVSVRPGSAAATAGLQKGDVIFRIGEWQIRRLSDVIEVLRLITPDVPIEVEVVRGLETETVTVTVVPEKDEGRQP